MGCGCGGAGKQAGAPPVKPATKNDATFWNGPKVKAGSKPTKPS